MTTDRVYRAALPEQTAAREMLDNAGTQFDPEVVAAVLLAVAAEVPTGGPVGVPVAG